MVSVLFRFMMVLRLTFIDNDFSFDKLGQWFREKGAIEGMSFLHQMTNRRIPWVKVRNAATRSVDQVA